MILSIFFSLTFLSGIIMTKIFRKTALKYNIVDIPSSKIKFHKKATPYLGGVAFIFNSILFYLAYLLISNETNIFENKEVYLLIFAFIILILGVIDDIRKIKPVTKIIIQSLIISGMIILDIRLHIIYLPKFVNIILTYFWILGITNAFNLIDIMDGLCGGIAFIASIFLFFTSQSPHIFLIFLAISLFAFLIYNFPPAKIFMGDAGSLSLGFLLASYSILGSYGSNNRLALISPILILWLPIYETILVSVMRIKKGKSPLMGSKDHFAFRLRKLKFPKLAILLISYFITIIMGETAFLAAYMDLENAILVYSLLMFFFVIFFYLLSLIKVEDYNE